MNVQPLINQLIIKQRNLAASLDQAATMVLIKERELRDALDARAACDGAKQQIDETLNALLELRDAPAAQPPQS
jgi:hypothetical protein